MTIAEVMAFAENMLLIKSSAISVRKGSKITPNTPNLKSLFNTLQINKLLTKLGDNNLTNSLGRTASSVACKG